MKVHENLNHFKYSLLVNKNVIYSSFFKSSTSDYLHLDWINFNRNDFAFISRRPVTVVTMLLSVFLFSRQAWLQEVFPTTSCHPSVLKGVNSFSVKNLPTFACIFLLVVPQVSTVGPSSGNRNSSKADRSEGSGSSSLVTPVVIAVVVVMVAIILILVLVYLRRKRLLMVKTGGKRCELR